MLARRCFHGGTNGIADFSTLSSHHRNVHLLETYEDVSWDVRDLILSDPNAGLSPVGVDIRQKNRPMESYLVEIKAFMRDGGGSLPRPLIQVYAARRRLPGEQRPLRLADGATLTQPLRGSHPGTNRGEAATNAPTLIEGEEKLDVPRPPPQSCCPAPLSSGPSNLNPMLGLSTSDKGKGKAGPLINSTRDSLTVPYQDIQNPNHILAANT